MPVVLEESLKVGAGAALGAVARYAVTLAVPVSTPGEAVALTLVINVIGCLAMGYLAPGPFLGKGVLGGFTTFSAMSLAAAQSSPTHALVIVAATFVLCVGAWLLGDALRERSRRTPA